MFFRVAMPARRVRGGDVLPVRAWALWPIRRLIKLLIALGAGVRRAPIFPTIFIENLAQKRQTAIKIVFPDALDMLLICVQSGMSVEAAFGRVVEGNRRPSRWSSPRS